MSSVVEHLAELTGFRDRDVLDVTLIAALKDLVDPLGAAIYRRVGEVDQPRWLTRACMAPGQQAVTADSVWASFDSLPPLHAHPERMACLQRQEAFSVPGPPAMAFFPLLAEGDCCAVLEMHTAQPLTPDAVRLVGSILRVVRNFQALLDYSERDTLTGLLNRKTFDESFMRVAARGPAVAHQLPGVALGRPVSATGRTWLGVIDIDHFKRVNDDHGHLIGDEVLLLLARLMRGCFRFDDYVYRFGGEEFVVLMRCNSTADACSALERLRRTVREYPFPQVGRISVSAGLTELRDGDAPSAAFERADRALYFAKQNGRDQVRDHAVLVTEGQLFDTARASKVELF